MKGRTVLTRSAAYFVIASTLVGCVAGPDHTPPEMPLPAKFAEGGAKDIGDVATVTWWTAFRDKQLDSLVARGIDQNLDVLQAMERINAAAGNVTAAGAGSLPSLVVGASQTVAGQMGELRTQVGAENTTAGDANISWLLDLFGQFRRSKESALASLDVGLFHRRRRQARLPAGSRLLLYRRPLLPGAPRAVEGQSALAPGNLRAHPVPAGSRRRLQARRRPGRGSGAVDAGRNPRAGNQLPRRRPSHRHAARPAGRRAGGRTAEGCSPSRSTAPASSPASRPT